MESRVVFAESEEISAEVLQQGIKVELEHKDTIEKIKKDKNITAEAAAELIAKDHLGEDPEYYTKLKEVEKTAADPTLFDEGKEIIDVAKANDEELTSRLSWLSDADLNPDNMDQANAEVDRISAELKKRNFELKAPKAEKWTGQMATKPPEQITGDRAYKLVYRSIRYGPSRHYTLEYAKEQLALHEEIVKDTEELIAEGRADENRLLNTKAVRDAYRDLVAEKEKPKEIKRQPILEDILDIVPPSEAQPEQLKLMESFKFAVDELCLTPESVMDMYMSVPGVNRDMALDRTLKHFRGKMSEDVLFDRLKSRYAGYKKLSARMMAMAPPGWEGTVKEMKDEPGIDNPWALSWWMKNKGYTPGGKDKKKKSGNWEFFLDEKIYGRDYRGFKVTIDNAEDLRHFTDYGAHSNFASSVSDTGNPMEIGKTYYVAEYTTHGGEGGTGIGIFVNQENAKRVLEVYKNKFKSWYENKYKKQSSAEKTATGECPLCGNPLRPSPGDGYVCLTPTCRAYNKQVVKSALEKPVEYSMPHQVIVGMQIAERNMQYLDIDKPVLQEDQAWVITKTEGYSDQSDIYFADQEAAQEYYIANTRKTAADEAIVKKLDVFDRVESTTIPGFKGYVVEINDIKPGDQDIGVYWDEELHGNHWTEVHPEEIKHVEGEEISDEMKDFLNKEIEAKKKATDEYRNRFKKDVAKEKGNSETAEHTGETVASAKFSEPFPTKASTKGLSRLYVERHRACFPDCGCYLCKGSEKTADTLITIKEGLMKHFNSLVKESALTMKEFDEGDFSAFSGAESGPSGESPLIGYADGEGRETAYAVIVAYDSASSTWVVDIEDFGGQRIGTKSVSSRSEGETVAMRLPDPLYPKDLEAAGFQKGGM